MGLGLAVALGASNTLETLTVNQYFHILFRVALHLKVTQLGHCICHRSPLPCLWLGLALLDTSSALVP